MAKSRNLTILQLFEILQLEYLCADLRMKISTSIKDKNYWEKIKTYKLKSFQDIALRNQLKTILDDEKLKRQIYQRLINDNSVPQFLYRDTEQEVELKEKDFKNYYYIGSEVRFIINSEVTTGIITNYNYGDDILHVQESHTSMGYQLRLEEVQRIF